MTDSHAAPRPALEALTGLRFVAALAVVLYHVRDTILPSASGPLARLAAHGYLGVSLFFVLSGFILTYTYVDPVAGSLRGTRTQFWWARLARIYPMYLAALVLAAPFFLLFRVMLAAPSARMEALPALALAPALLQAWWPRAACQWNCPGWSLSVEAFFYALFPLVAIAMARAGRRAWNMGLAAWIASLAIPLAYLQLAPDGLSDPTRFDHGRWLEAVKFFPVVHLGAFVLGIATGLAFVRGEARWSASRPFVAMVVVALGLAGVALSSRLVVPYLLLHDGLLAPLWAAVILVLAQGGGVAGRALASRAMVRLGEASYALYLVHAPVLGYFVLARRWLGMRHGVEGGALLQLAIYLGLVIPAALFLFRRIEEPARRALRRRGGFRAALHGAIGNEVRSA